MSTNKRRNGDPMGVHNRGAKRTIFKPGVEPGTAEGLWSDPEDGRLGDASERLRELVDEEDATRDEASTTREAPSASGPTDRPATAATNIDLAGEIKHGQGPYVAGSLPDGAAADHVGGMGTGTGRGRGGGVYGSGDSAGTGGMGGGFDSQVGPGGASGSLGSDIGGGLTDGTGGQGLPRRNDQRASGGGVAVSGGRGSDVGTVGGGMAPDLSSDTTGGPSGAMRSGMGHDASGGRGGASSRQKLAVVSAIRTVKATNPPQD